MATEDAREFGPIVDKLVGRECERTLATNTIKLRFETDKDPRGDFYIWIDPPWTLFRCDQVVTASDDYIDQTFEEWSRLFDPLNRIRFVGWEIRADTVVFSFSNGYSIVVPQGDEVREEDSWYAHWYARKREGRRGRIGEGTA